MLRCRSLPLFSRSLSKRAAMRGGVLMVRRSSG
jgi:hypothetical protein